MKMNQLKTLQLDALTATTSEHARLLCARAKELEEGGKFEDARLVLTEFWQRIGDYPKLEDLDEPAKAELLLRVGTLSGWIGSTNQIPGAQESAKDLISASSAIFEKLALTEKVAEAQVGLGICYWRAGALDEARITFDDALLRLGDLESEQRLRALLNKAIVEQVSSRHTEAIRLLSESEPLFEASNNHALKGKFHNEFGTVLKNVGLAERREDYIDRSLMHYTAASFEFEQAGHELNRAQVENNLGFLFAHLQRFDEAHQHLDRALSAVKKLNDKGLRAQFEDTRARVFIAQGRINQAEALAKGTVKILKEGDEQSLLAEALTTHATALAKLGRHTNALAVFNEAVSVAAQAGDPETGGIASLTIVEELASVLSPTELRDYYKNADSALKHSQHSAIEYRLAKCARAVLASEYGDSAVGAERSTPDAVSAGISLEEQVLRFEGELIKRALQRSDGSVTRAARLLGVTHQGLAFILNGRQKNLLPSRKPAKPRRRSIIRYH
jgi:tetratricopeptide (TPR) repeat protein